MLRTGTIAAVAAASAVLIGSKVKQDIKAFPFGPYIRRGGYREYRSRGRQAEGNVVLAPGQIAMKADQSRAEI